MLAFHSDSVQAAGKVPVDLRAMHADIYSISGHKIYAPKGTGALFIRKGLPLRASGAWQRQPRGPVPGRARKMLRERWRLGPPRNGSISMPRPNGRCLWNFATSWSAAFSARIADSHVNAEGSLRAPNVTNIRFDGIDSEAASDRASTYEGSQVSAGSACSSGAREPSPVLLAIGLTQRASQVEHPLFAGAFERCRTGGWSFWSMPSMQSRHAFEKAGAGLCLMGPLPSRCRAGSTARSSRGCCARAARMWSGSRCSSAESAAACRTWLPEGGSSGQMLFAWTMCTMRGTSRRFSAFLITW